jgi:hypothetical protein
MQTPCGGDSKFSAAGASNCATCAVGSFTAGGTATARTSCTAKSKASLGAAPIVGIVLGILLLPWASRMCASKKEATLDLAPKGGAPAAAADAVVPVAALEGALAVTEPTKNTV